MNLPQGALPNVVPHVQILRANGEEGAYVLGDIVRGEKGVELW